MPGLKQSADLRATLVDVSPKRPGTQMCKERTMGGIEYDLFIHIFIIRYINILIIYYIIDTRI